MYCQACGGVWFTEARQIIAPREPGAGQQASASRVRYAYTCSDCGLAVGAKPKPKRRRKAA